jgi:cyclopropane-fatty-acyl-phospholipid synthase
MGHHGHTRIAPGRTEQTRFGLPTARASRHDRVSVREGRYKKCVADMLSPAGIEINGNNSWDIQVTNKNFYGRVLRQGSLGLGDSYVDGWWDCACLDELFCRLSRYQLMDRMKWNLAALIPFLLAGVFNMQSRAKAFQIGETHYDLGNLLFRKMLDKRLTYTCGYWDKASTLDAAQEAKLELVCRKLELQPGMHVLDIGCGWGSFVKYAAEKHGVTAVGITVSREQVQLGKELCEGLPVEFRLQDYRDVAEKFDRIVSLGMFEHVGPRNYRTYMEVIRRCLADDGLFLLQTIGSNKTNAALDPWINKYIFPHGVLPSIRQIGAAVEGLFVMEDWHNFSANYDQTLMAWYRNFENGWDELSASYDERFHRMWKYYLLACAGSFRARANQLWQIVFSTKGVPGGYRSLRLN